MGLILPLRLCRDPEHTQSQQICPYAKSCYRELWPVAGSWPVLGRLPNESPDTNLGLRGSPAALGCLPRPKASVPLGPLVPGRALCHFTRTGSSPRGAHSQLAKRGGMEFTRTFAPALITGQAQRQSSQCCTTLAALCTASSMRRSHCPRWLVPVGC